VIWQQPAEALVGPIGSGALMRTFATVSNGICLIVDGP
jgi:hypothetical protein